MAKGTNKHIDRAMEVLTTSTSTRAQEKAREKLNDLARRHPDHPKIRAWFDGYWGEEQNKGGYGDWTIGGVERS